MDIELPSETQDLPSNAGIAMAMSTTTQISAQSDVMSAQVLWIPEKLRPIHVMISATGIPAQNAPSEEKIRLPSVAMHLTNS